MASTTDPTLRGRRAAALVRSLPAMLMLALAGVLAGGCTFQGYTFTSSKLNYDLVKTIQIDNIANRAPYGWAPMGAMFNTKLQDRFANQTRLKLVKRNGDLQIAGEITGYDQFNKAISADGYSSQVQLKVTVNIRFNSAKLNQNWERQFSATTQYNSSQQLSAVQETLVDEMLTDITDQIFNATVADW